MIIGFDIETTPFVEGKTVKLKLWTLYSPFYKKSGYYKKDLIKEIQYLYRLLDKVKQDIIIVAHNLPFDYINSINKIPVSVVAHRKPIVNILSKPAFAIFPQRKYKGRKTYRLYFCDLLNFVSGKLVQVALDFGVSKKMDKSAIYLPRKDPKLLEYCFNDAKICYQVLTEINPFFPKHRFRFTAASLSFPRLKAESGWEFFVRPWWAMEQEREAYYGGRVQKNRHMDIDGRDWYTLRKYDINSMYSYIMKHMKVHTGWLGKKTRLNGAYTDATAYDFLAAIHESDDMTAVVKCKVQLLSDALPYRVDKKLYFDAQDEHGSSKVISGTWCIEELFPALKDREANLIYVSAVYLYKAKKGMFASYCDKWYKVKQEASDPDNPQPVKYFMAKLFLNTPYGKFGQKKIKSHKPRKIIDRTTLAWLRKKDYYTLDYPVTRGKTTKIYKVEVASGIVSISEQLNKDVYGACCAVAAAITALARRYLWEHLRDYQWLYCDTDSMLLLDPQTMMAEHYSETEMGMWKFEACSASIDVCDYQIKGRKDYRCRHDMTMKGTPKFDIDEKPILTHDNYEGNFWRFTRVVKMRESLRNKKLIPYSLQETTRRRLY